MHTEPFYSTPAFLPPLAVTVRVWWGGRGPFGAARVTKPWLKARNIPLPRRLRDDENAWVVRPDGYDVMLVLPNPTLKPIDFGRPWIGWHRLGITKDGDFFDPEFWAPPLDRADAWRQAQRFPEPACFWDPTLPPRLWHQAGSFDAAEAAAEMEADRERAADLGPEKRSNRIGEQWFRNAVGIRYDKESLNLHMAHWRVARALMLADPFRGLGPKNPKISRAMEELKALSQSEIRDRARNMPPEDELGIPLRPTPQDHADFLTAMSWFVSLNPPPSERTESWQLSSKQLALVRRTQPMPRSYREIGDELRPQVSGERARQIHQEAIEDIWKVAVGLKPNLAHSEIEALRERNRAFRRNQSEVIL